MRKSPEYTVVSTTWQVIHTAVTKIAPRPLWPRTSHLQRQCLGVTTIEAMRLLHAPSFELCFFTDDLVPPYAILSHTWADEEVTYHDLSQRQDARAKQGWNKIQKGCALARSLDLEYIWIDTCCIDKSSSAELSEAINSMFKWYENARLCIAFLSDWDAAADTPDSKTFRSSRWFTRGWTLQELIAPAEVLFFDRHWIQAFTRDSLKTLIHDVTGIPTSILEAAENGDRQCRQRLDGVSVAQRMSWAAKRTTTRSEDAAYCLLGIFDINMPLLYGEGATKAFRRLQDEIIKSTDDESLYAWSYSRDVAEKRHFWGLLADSPAAFGNYGDMIPRRSRYLTRSSGRTVTVSNRGLLLDLFVTPFPKDMSRTIFLAFLDCDMRREGSSSSLSPVILLQRTAWDNGSDMVRIRTDILGLSMMNNVVLPDELANLLSTGSGAGSILQQPELRQIFIPHSYMNTRPPGGVVFHPEIQHPLNNLTLSVQTRSPTWQYFIGMKGGSVERLYEINFEQNPIPDVDGLKESKVLGEIEIVIERGGKKKTTRSSCLVVGLEALPANPFSTPALYFVPWCAFEEQSKVAAGEFERVLDKTVRKGVLVVDEDVVVGVFDLETRYSKLVFQLKLETKNMADMKGFTWSK